MLNVDYITMCMFCFNHNFDLEIGKMGSITVFIKIKDDSYIPTIDKAFIELVKMEKIKEGVYHLDDDVFAVCSNIVEALMEKEWFWDTVILLVLKAGDEVEDLLENFNNNLKNVNNKKHYAKDNINSNINNMIVKKVLIMI